MKPIEASKPEPAEQPEPESKDARIFLWIASLATALGLGAAVATIQSLRRDANGLSLQLSAGTAVAFVIGAVIGLLYWRIAAKSHKAAKLGSWAFAILGIALFLYPLRFVAKTELPELEVGIALATVALSIAGFMLWQVKRFLDADTRETELAESQAAKSKRANS